MASSTTGNSRSVRTKAGPVFSEATIVMAGCFPRATPNDERDDLQATPPAGSTGMPALLSVYDPGASGATSAPPPSAGDSIAAGPRDPPAISSTSVRGETRETLTPCPSPGGRAESSFPPLVVQAASLFQAAVAFVGDGCALVEDAEYRRRLDVCRNCDRRTGRRCAACGCWIGLKARGRAFACPLGRWEQQVR